MKFVSIFHPGRVGSTYLREILSQLRYFHLGEVFLPGNPFLEFTPNQVWQDFGPLTSFMAYITSLAGMAHRDAYDVNGDRSYRKEPFFFEVKLNAYGLDPINSLIAICGHGSHSLSVFLYSRNYLRRYLSVARAISSGVWHVYEQNVASYKPQLVSLNPNQIIDPDILGAAGPLPLEEAVVVYRAMMHTQYNIIKQTACAVMPLAFEDLRDSPASSVLSILNSACIQDIENSASVTSELSEALDNVSILPTGFHDPLDGLSGESRELFESRKELQVYLPGGPHDLYL